MSQTLDAYRVKKSCSTAYHPQGDRMVEQFNQSHLQLLQAYVAKYDEWEHFLH